MKQYIKSWLWCTYQFSKQKQRRSKFQMPELMKPIDDGMQKQKLRAESKELIDSLGLNLNAEEKMKQEMLYVIINYFYKKITKPTEIYKKIDADLQNFFVRREYNLKNFNFLIQVLGEQNKLDIITSALALMEKLNIKQNELTLISLIKAYGRQNQIEKAEEYYDIAKHRFGASIYQVSSLMYVYARNNQVEKAEKLFKELRSLGLKPDAVIYTNLINAHYRCKNLSKCWQLFNQVALYSTTPPDENLLGLMIEIASHTHEAEKAIQLYDYMSNMEFREQTHVYNAFIKAMGSRKDYAEKGIELFREMFAKQIAIDSDTVVHTLKACSQIGDLKTAFEVLNKMKDFKIEKNKYIYNQIIRVYAGALKLQFLPKETADMYIQDSWVTLRQAIECKMVSVNILNSMGKLMANAGKLADLEGLVFPLYQELSIKKDEFSYENLLKLLSEEKRLHDIYRVWDVILAEKLIPSFESICYYLDCAILESNEDKIVDALEWFDKVKRTPKNKYLKYFGMQETLPVRIHAILDKYDLKFGLVKSKELRGSKPDKYIKM